MRSGYLALQRNHQQRIHSSGIWYHDALFEEGAALADKDLVVVLAGGEEGHGAVGEGADDGVVGAAADPVFA